MQLKCKINSLLIRGLNRGKCWLKSDILKCPLKIYSLATTKIQGGIPSIEDQSPTRPSKLSTFHLGDPPPLHNICKSPINNICKSKPREGNQRLKEVKGKGKRTSENEWLKVMGTLHKKWFLKWLLKFCNTKKVMRALHKN